MASIPLSVSYCQIAVFESSLERPFNVWTDKHVKQGFAWRPESVSFRTVEEAGRHVIDIVIGDVGLSADAARIIQVPFEVPPSGSIEVASISDSVSQILPPGRYALRFECFPSTRDVGPRVRLVFMKINDLLFAIVRADADLAAVDDLLLTASPA
jgi:hypothetical protein